MPATLQLDQLRRYSLPEYGSIDLDLEPTTAADLHRDGHVFVSPSEPAGRYTVKAKHKVGVLRYDDIELQIVPKVSVSRLLYLASHVEDSRSWQDFDTSLGTADDPLSAVAHALARHAELALRPTPLQGYVTHEAAERRLRGRILFDQQSRRAGLQFPVDLRYDDFELNIVENRILKAALSLVQPHVAENSLASRLAHLRFQLDGVDPWPTGARVPDITFTRLNDRYRTALAISRLVIEQRSLEFPGHTQRGSAFLFNMNQVFERYVEVSLRDALESRRGRVDGQRSIYLDEDDTLLMKPDITWWSGNQCLAVADAKYKRLVNDDFPNADAYQLLAYCTRLDLPRGVLIYAGVDGSHSGSAVVRNAGIELVTTVLDISGPLDEIRSDVARLADLVSSAGSLD